MWHSNTATQLPQDLVSHVSSFLVGKQLSTRNSWKQEI